MAKKEFTVLVATEAFEKKAVGAAVSSLVAEYAKSPIQDTIDSLAKQNEDGVMKGKLTGAIQALRETMAGEFQPIYKIIAEGLKAAIPSEVYAHLAPTVQLSEGKAKAARTKLSKVEMQELKDKVKAALTKKTKQTEFIKSFLSTNSGYKDATIKKIIGDFRESKDIKTEEVEANNPKAGIFLIPA